MHNANLMVSTYQHKGVGSTREVRAIQWMVTNLDVIQRDFPEVDARLVSASLTRLIVTPGSHPAATVMDVGDWLVRDEHGFTVVILHWAFEQLYALVEQPTLVTDAEGDIWEVDHPTGRVLMRNRNMYATIPLHMADALFGPMKAVSGEN